MIAYYREDLARAEAAPFAALVRERLLGKPLRLLTPHGRSSRRLQSWSGAVTPDQERPGLVARLFGCR